MEISREGCEEAFGGREEAGWRKRKHGAYKVRLGVVR